MSSTETALATLQLVIRAIEADQDEDLAKYLNNIPLKSLSAEETDDLLMTFLEHARLFTRTNLTPIIFNAWQFVYPTQVKSRDRVVTKKLGGNTIKYNDLNVYTSEGTSLPLMVDLFINPLYSFEILAFVRNSYPSVSFLKIIFDLMDYDIGTQIYFTCKRVLEVYGEQEKNVYETLLESNRLKNSTIEEFLRDRIRRVADYAPIPVWVKNFTNGPIPKESDLKIPESPEINFTIPTIDIAAQLLTAGLDDLGITPDEKSESIQKVRENLQKMSQIQQLEQLKPVLEYNIGEEEETSLELFRLLGPANPLIQGEPEDMKYGGERMFTGDYYDYDPDLGVIEDWFEGFCLKCDKRIRHRWHALRIPDYRGGWHGSYCSVKCARGAELESENYDILTLVMLDLTVEQLIGIGIQDRLPDDITNLSYDITGLSDELETVGVPEFTVPALIEEPMEELPVITIPSTLESGEASAVKVPIISSPGILHPEEEIEVPASGLEGLQEPAPGSITIPSIPGLIFNNEEDFSTFSSSPPQSPGRVFL